MEHDPRDALPLEPLENFPAEYLPNLFPIPEMCEVSATTEADIYRHGIARVELLDCLAADPDVCARLDAWGSTIGLMQASEALARLLEAKAQLCGLRHRSELWGAGDLEPFDEAQDQALDRQVNESFQHYHEALAHSDEVYEAAKRYVRDELGLHWGPWLALTLFIQVLSDAWMYVLGVERAFAFGYQPPDPPAQDFSWTFTNRPGETVSALGQRFIEEANAALAEIQPVPDAPEQIPLGRQRRDLEEKTRRNTRWFYQRKVRRETLWRIARDYHAERVDRKPCKRPFPSCGCEKIVRKGIEEAERVLSLTPYFF
jgi:hypothetical protein